MKKIISLLLLLSFLPPSFAAAQSAESPFTDIYELIDQLVDNQKQQSELIEKLQTASEEDSIEIEKLLTQLRESEQEKLKQIALSQNLGNLIEDRKIYLESLERKLKFWKIFTMVLGGICLGVTAGHIFR